MMNEWRNIYIKLSYSVGNIKELELNVLHYMNFSNIMLSEQIVAKKYAQNKTIDGL